MGLFFLFNFLSFFSVFSVHSVLSVSFLNLSFYRENRFLIALFPENSVH